ncbi:ribonuclease H-like domain-containing protein [Zychaea mexicana]|uniref:ribonuclease H-like domain-containing protein n=1 Tax=Zychaea mexicana TaxID=64656 RepID=UPI0022FEFD00|nr:ribonuclease H-like domain-containing protein [Zychaea mexicana]KAI9492025.1 ribonuclease H-like domain-containing protein [Zychaea mexicana]
MIIPQSTAVRILSTDIECIFREYFSAPEARYDSVLQISGVAVNYYGNDHAEIKQKIVFTLDTCAAIDGVKVVECETERALLSKWRIFLLKFDPDVLTGFYSNKFDLKYLIERAERLGLATFPYFGRELDEKVVIKPSAGRKPAVVEDVPGRMIIDMYDYIKEQYPNLSRYTLDAVSHHFLGDRKEHMNYFEIPGLQMGDEYTRQRLAKYCLKDSMLAYELFKKLQPLENILDQTAVPMECYGCEEQ